jgi:hypothetical protein
LADSLIYLSHKVVVPDMRYVCCPLHLFNEFAKIDLIEISVRVNLYRQIHGFLPIVQRLTMSIEKHSLPRLIEDHCGPALVPGATVIGDETRRPVCDFNL